MTNENELAEQLHLVAAQVDESIEEHFGHRMSFVVILGHEDNAMYVGNTSFGDTLILAKAFVSRLEELGPLQQSLFNSTPPH